ncbi:ANTAR domain-containing protein [Streptomyces sp. SAI-041]|uniref:ANTAR domain-containing protein n=1 Tax=Streptomyces sp. SAI-041 TaxID=2940548 RepID=UPI00247DC88D|nr:hypothetical protein [Streptomyces sp. SAI-041]
MTVRPRDADGEEPGPFPGAPSGRPEDGTDSFAQPADERRGEEGRDHDADRDRDRERALGQGDHQSETRQDRRPTRQRARDSGRAPNPPLTAAPNPPRPPDHPRVSDVIAAGVRGAAPVQVPGKLCVAAVELLPVVGASVSLRSKGMPVQLSASSDRAAQLSDIQATLGDGPCTAAAASGAAVFATDLTSGGDAGRWPVFAEEATAAGIRAVYSMPLGNDTVCVGTLDLYRDVPGELTRRERRVAELVANVMTVALMALPRDEEYGPEGDAPWLSGLATAHDEVYQAVGMVMVQLGADADEALARLRAHAFAHGRSVLEVAHEVVRHRRRLAPD